MLPVIFAALAAWPCHAILEASKELMAELVEDHQQGAGVCHRSFNFEPYYGHWIPGEAPKVELSYDVRNCRTGCVNSIAQQDYMADVLTVTKRGKDCLCYAKGETESFMSFTDPRAVCKGEVGAIECMRQLGNLGQWVLNDHTKYLNAHDDKRMHGPFLLTDVSKWQESTCTEAARTIPTFSWKSFGAGYFSSVQAAMKQNDIVLAEFSQKAELALVGTSCSELTFKSHICRPAAAADDFANLLRMLKISDSVLVPHESEREIAIDSKHIEVPATWPCDSVSTQEDFVATVSYSVKKKGGEYEVPTGYSVVSLSESPLRIIKRGDATGSETAPSEKDFRPICVCDPKQ